LNTDSESLPMTDKRTDQFTNWQTDQWPVCKSSSPKDHYTARNVIYDK